MTQNLGKDTYAFHMRVGELKGIEIYFGSGSGKPVAQAFYAPECEKRVNACMVLGATRGLSSICTVRNTDSVLLSHGKKDRSMLTAEETAEFEKRGVKVRVLEEYKLE